MSTRTAAKPITFVLPDLGGGGAQKVILSVAEGLDRARFAPRILIVGGSQTFAARLPTDLPVEIGQAKRLRDGLPWLIRRIRATDPVVCVSVMGYLNLALLASRLAMPARTRLIVREANAIGATTRALPGWVPGRMLYRTLYPRADAIISPTTLIADEIAALAPRAASRLAVIVNPVDVMKLRGSATPPRRRPGAGLRLVSAGRLTPQKGYDCLLDLMPTLPVDAHLTIFGEGEKRTELEARARELRVSDRVEFPGFSTDVSAWIAGADGFLLPSRWEGLPNVVLESLALGTPAVVSDQAGATELAAAAPAGAIMIRPVDTSFASAIRALTIVGHATFPRPSLLPIEYEQAASISRWSELIEKIAGSGPPD